MSNDYMTLDDVEAANSTDVHYFNNEDGELEYELGEHVNPGEYGERYVGKWRITALDPMQATQMFNENNEALPDDENDMDFDLEEQGDLIDEVVLDTVTEPSLDDGDLERIRRFKLPTFAAALDWSGLAGEESETSQEFQEDSGHTGG